jgi:hypothetical protein
MGQSTNAILCWGIQVGEEDSLPWDDKAEEMGYDGGNDDEFLADALCGIKKPKDEWEDGGENKVHRDYWTVKKEALEAYGIELVWHCSGEYPMYILAIAASEKTARRGYPETIVRTDMDRPEADNWQEKLNEACEKLGIEPSAGEWILCSMWM